MATEPKVRTAPSHAAAQHEAPAGTGNVRVNTRPPQRPNPASRPADSTQATESQGHPHLYTTEGESAGGHRDACPGEADRPSRKEGPGAFDNRLLVSSSDPCTPRLSLSSHRQICPLSLGSLPSRGHPRAGAASVPVMGWPQARTWALTPVRRMDPTRGVQSIFSLGPHRVGGRKNVLDSSLTPNATPLAESGRELMALSQRWRVRKTDRQRDSGALAAAPGIVGVTRG